MLPIVQRELQTAARHRSLYRWRTISGFGGIIAVLFAVSTQDPRKMRGGGTFFETLSFIAFLICLAEGLRKTADSISNERREGTLGLLFLSTLSGTDIILGKLASALVRSLSTLLTFVPVLAVSLLIGGTTGAEFWRVILTLVVALFLSLSVCLCVSVFSHEASFGNSLFWLFAICVVPFAGFFAGNGGTRWIVPASPFYTLRSSFEAFYSFDSHRYWLGLAYLLLLSLSSLTLASYLLPRAWQDRPFKQRKTSRLSGPLSPKLLAYHRAMLDRNPTMWLFFNPRTHQKFRSLVLSLLLLAVFGTAVVMFFRNPASDDFEFIFPAVALVFLVLASCLRVARATSYNFAEARSNGALELMLSTPLKVQDIISGQWLALHADLKPALLLFVTLGSVLLLLAIGLGEPGAIFYTLKSLAEAVLAVMATANVGLWMGLTAKTPARAHFWTIALGFVAPFVFCIPTIINQLVILGIAAGKVQTNFRRFVADRYLPSGTLAPIPPTLGQAPPVIR